MVIILTKHILTPFFTLLQLILLTLYIVPLTCSAQVINWTFDDLTQDVLSSGVHPDFVIDQQGNFHISYWDRNLDQLVYTFKEKDSASWSREEVDPDRASGFKSSLYIDNEGIPHIAYLYNYKDSAFLAYTTRSEEGWIHEDLPLRSDLGKYGFDMFFPSFNQASIDLTLTEKNHPLISFYDGTMTEWEVLCPPVIALYKEAYDMYMGYAYKENTEWTIIDTLAISMKKPTDCLLNGDRFGEFNQIIPWKEDHYFTITNSMHNNELLLFESNKYQLQNWEIRVLDSVNRFASNGANAAQKFRETFDFIDISNTNDSLIHMVYGVSGLYGFENRTVYVNAAPFNRRTYFYASFHPDSLEKPEYSPFYKELGERNNANNPNSHDGLYRTFHTISTRGDTSIYTAHYNAGSGDIVLNYSQDQGRNWNTDTLGIWLTNSSLQSQIWEDSLHIVFYDGLEEQLMWASTQLDRIQWNIRPIFTNTQTGNILSSIPLDQDHLQFVYHERINDQLIWGTFQGDNLNLEVIDDAGLQISSAVNSTILDTIPIVIYASWQSGELKYALRENDTWNYRVIADSVLGTDLNIAYSNDSLFITYFDLMTQTLQFGSWNRSSTNGTWRISTIPTEGQRPNLAQLHVDQEENVHITYIDKLSNQLIHSKRSIPSTEWETDTVILESQFQAGIHDVQTLSDGTLWIAIRDESNNKIVFAENTLGTWTLTELPTENSTVVGSSLQLLIDDRTNPWVVYNQVAITDELKLLTRNNENNWIEYITIGNQENIAQLFDAHIVEQQLMVLGKKLTRGNPGLGLLRASIPVTTPISSDLSQSGITLYPNPANDEIFINIPRTSESIAPNIALYDMQGRLIPVPHIETALNNDSYIYTVSIHTLPAGLYLCRIESGAKNLFRKFIKTE